METERNVDDSGALGGGDANASRVRVLLVEDNPGDARLIREWLRETGGDRFELEVVARLSAAIERLRLPGIGLVLLDLSLPDSSGVETFQRLHAAAPETPIIVLSGLTNEAVAVQAVHEGAQDYLVKGMGDGHLLVRAMRYAVERAAVAGQLSRYAEELRRKNAQMEADVAMAREMQLSFLPQQYPSFPPDAPPGRGELQFCHRYLPAAEVGGDFFAVLPVGPRAAGVFLCDVMGHGLRAALLTAVLRGVLEEVKAGAGAPGRFLADVNRSFHSILRRTDETILATGFYAVVDAERGEVRYASAGHPSPLLLDRRRGVVRSLRQGMGLEGAGPQGPALGLSEATEYREGRSPMSRGDLVLLFTDGLYESANRAGEEYGLERLRERVAASLPLPGAALLEEVLAGVEQFTGRREFEDDVCVVAVEWVE